MINENYPFLDNLSDLDLVILRKEAIDKNDNDFKKYLDKEIGRRYKSNL